MITMEENKEKNAGENTYKNRADSRLCWTEGGERERVNVIFFVVMPRTENVRLCGMPPFHCIVRIQ